MSLKKAFDKQRVAARKRKKRGERRCAAINTMLLDGWSIFPRASLMPVDHVARQVQGFN
jgi:hypothetical protein